ncbi:hypothetical protein CLM62_03485 [Streptomyces sp. SA15]|uniref:hypothetical protein n=1 Tax=Streptomyces sp. SA15 TaxID=934019 RepID=UPI000BAF9F6B|nr:hypothetical protein [Streptomyces sp. SA15]PAZ17245.1 hypothetical protein CLM62_03485 [Streptomyces sp. SA15]
MRKFQKAAVVVAALGSVSFLGAGVGQAADGDPKVKIDNKQNQACENNEEYKGLLKLGDVNLGLAAILGLSEIDSSERSSVTCQQSFLLGR